MRNILIVLLGLICGILLLYSDSPAALIFSFIYMTMLGLAVWSVRPRAVAVMLAGILLGVLTALSYNSLKIENNNYYVKSTYLGRFGIQDRFSIKGRLLAVDTYSNRQWDKTKGPGSSPVNPGQTVRLTGAFLKTRYNPDGILYRGSKVTVTVSQEPLSLLARLEEGKRTLAGRLQEVMGVEAGSLAASLVLGVKDDSLRERTDLLRFLGVIHILSISGFHVNLLEGLLRRGGLRRLSTPVILGYALLVNSVPAWRAAFMKLSKGLAGLFRRDSDAANQLIFAALIQLTREPYLLFNRSFQLTYAATLGLIFFTRPIQERLMHFPLGKLKETVCLSVAAMIPCVPFLATMSPDINLALFPANFLIVPLYSVFCALSFLVLPLIALDLGWACGPAVWAADGILRLINFLEYILFEYASLRVAWTGAALLFLMASLIFIMKRYNLTVQRQIRVLAVSYFILFNLYFLPGTTRILFEKNMGQARVLVQKNFSQVELVTARMYKRAVRLTAVPVESPLTVLGLTVTPDAGAFPRVFVGGVPLSPSGESSSDIINEEYLWIFGKLIRLK